MREADSFDHAGWVQDRIIERRHRKPTKRDRIARARHLGWYAAPDQLTTFQRRAFNFLGDVAGGIYNAPISWNSTWWSDNAIAVSWRGELATFDRDHLTRLVLLAHDACIRVAIDAMSRRTLEITLHERARDGRRSIRHPTIAGAIAEHRRFFPDTEPD